MQYDCLHSETVDPKIACPEISRVKYRGNGQMVTRKHHKTTQNTDRAELQTSRSKNGDRHIILGNVRLNQGQHEKESLKCYKVTLPFSKEAQDADITTQNNICYTVA